MPMPTGALANCPPGLEYLTQVDQLIIKQKVELFEGASMLQVTSTSTASSSGD